jgi:hypothetical protein
MAQVLYGMLYTLYIMSQISFSKISFALLMIIVSLLGEIFFTLMLSSLVVFHVYLVINNFTTWETLSYNKISYIRIWPRKYGSPFDRGLKENIKLYFKEKVQGRFLTWKMPTKLPTILQGEKMIENRHYSYQFEKAFIKCQ